MSCICKKLPVMTDCKLIKCIKISMNNGEEYIVKTDDLVAIQFIRNDERIFVRKGRIHDIVLVDKRSLSSRVDNVSRIILDCSEQFTIKTIEIKLKDIIKIGGLDDEFDDYSDRITELKPNFIEENRIPTREHGMTTEKEFENKITKPDRDDVVKMNPDTGIFDDLNNLPPIVGANKGEEKEIYRDDETLTEKMKKAGIIGMPIMM